MQASQKEEKKLLEPTSNLVTISSHKPANFFTYISKIYLKKFESIELRALGNAAEISVQVAENLERYGFLHVEMDSPRSRESGAKPSSLKTKTKRWSRPFDSPLF